jgi:cytochrome c-type biogenesis protein CcsB
MSWQWVIPLSYFISSVLYCGYLWTKNPKASVIGFYGICLGLLFQSINLIVLYMRGEPIAGGLDRSLFLFSWFITIVYLILQSKFNAVALGAFIAPLSLLMTLPSLLPHNGIIQSSTSLKNPMIIIHILLVLFGEALFTVAFFAGLVYIFQENRLKSKNLGGLIKKLPSLTTLDSINHICLLIGFPLLTLGLILGLLSARVVWGELWDWGQKETWSIAVWILYAVLIHGRVTSGWRGKKAAIGAVLGFVIILFSFFVIGYLAPGMHDFLIK